MKPVFTQEALESLQKFSSAIEQPMVIAGTFNHDQPFIGHLEAKGLKTIECKVIEFECSEVATPKITRTPFTTGQGENARVDYINTASTTRLQMNGIATLEVTGYTELVKVRMSVATLAAISGNDKAVLNCNIGAITVGRKASEGKKWLSVNSDGTPNFNKLLKILTPNVSEPNVTAAPKGKDKNNK